MLWVDSKVGSIIKKMWMILKFELTIKNLKYILKA